MATELEELVIKLTADTDGLRGELKSATQTLIKSTQSMEKSVSDFSKNSAKDVGFFQGSMATMAGFIGGQVVLGAIQAVSTAVIDLAQSMLVDGVKGAMETEAAMNRLATQMRLTGDYSESAIEQFKNLADSLERTTGLNDATSLSLLSLGKSMGFSNEQAMQLLQASNDLAAATGKDLQTAFTELGKTASGSAGRLGQTIPALKGMSEEALKAGDAIDYVAGRFKGSAEANAKTLEGALRVLGAQWGNVSKEIGKAIMENGTLSMITGKLSNAMSLLINWVDKNKAAISAFVNEAVAYSIASLKTFLDVLALITSSVKTLYQVVTSGIAIIQSSMKALVQFLEGDYVGAWDTMKETTVKAFDDIIAKAQETNVFETASKHVDNFGISVTDSMGLAGEKVKAVKDDVNSYQPEDTDDSAAKWAQKWIDAGKNVEEQNAAFDEIITAQRENDLAHHEELMMSKEEINLLYAETSLANLEAQQEAETQALANALAKQRKNKEDTLAAMTALEQKHAAEKIKADTLVEQNRTALNALRLQQTNQLLGNLATLSQTGSRELVAIGKAAAVAQAGMNIALGVTKALAEGGPFLGPLLAGSIIAAGAVQISKIMSTNLATGIDEVPGVGNRDIFPAMLAPGERVVPSNTNQDLKEFLANQGGMQGPSQTVDVNITMNENFMDMIEARLIERSRLSSSLQR